MAYKNQSNSINYKGNIEEIDSKASPYFVKSKAN